MSAKVAAASYVLIGVLSVVWMSKLGKRLKEGGGRGIVAFELAGNWKAVDRVLAGWDEGARQAARRSLVVDFAFIAAYSLGAAIAVMAVVDASQARAWQTFADVGRGLVYAAIAAGVSDAVENAALLVILSGNRGRQLPRIAAICAALKFFVLLPVVALYVAAGLIGLNASN
jgi:hypothetical protein